MQPPILTVMHIGYVPDFLGLPVPLPAAAIATTELDYPHFTVAFRPDRRLAAVSAVNIHGALLRDIERKRDVWILDPRIPAADQLDNTVYDANDFDRGHLTRRRDPGWGTAAQAKAANDATFHYTNAAPQASGSTNPRNCGPASRTNPHRCRHLRTAPRRRHRTHPATG